MKKGKYKRSSCNIFNYMPDPSPRVRVLDDIQSCSLGPQHLV